MSANKWRRPRSGRRPDARPQPARGLQDGARAAQPPPATPQQPPAPTAPEPLASGQPAQSGRQAAGQSRAGPWRAISKLAGLPLGGLLAQRLRRLAGLELFRRLVGQQLGGRPADQWGLAFAHLLLALGRPLARQPPVGQRPARALCARRRPARRPGPQLVPWSQQPSQAKRGPHE